MYIARPAMSQLQLFARLCIAPCHRILKLARTIVDLVDALQYLPKIMM